MATLKSQTLHLVYTELGFFNRIKVKMFRKASPTISEGLLDCFRIFFALYTVEMGTMERFYVFTMEDVKKEMEKGRVRGQMYITVGFNVEL